MENLKFLFKNYGSRMFLFFWTFFFSIYEIFSIIVFGWWHIFFLIIQVGCFIFVTCQLINILKNENNRKNRKECKNNKVVEYVNYDGKDGTYRTIE